jgi:hypothetical protein
MLVFGAIIGFNKAKHVNEPLHLISTSQLFIGKPVMRVHVTLVNPPYPSGFLSPASSRLACMRAQRTCARASDAGSFPLGWCTLGHYGNGEVRSQVAIDA